jgi:hypothetical protein
MPHWRARLASVLGDMLIPARDYLRGALRSLQISLEGRGGTLGVRSVETATRLCDRGTAARHTEVGIAEFPLRRDHHRPRFVG